MPPLPLPGARRRARERRRGPSPAPGPIFGTAAGGCQLVGRGSGPGIQGIGSDWSVSAAFPASPGEGGANGERQRRGDPKTGGGLGPCPGSVPSRPRDGRRRGEASPGERTRRSLFKAWGDWALPRASAPLPRRLTEGPWGFASGSDHAAAIRARGRARPCREGFASLHPLDAGVFGRRLLPGNLGVRAEGRAVFPTRFSPTSAAVDKGRRLGDGAIRAPWRSPLGGPLPPTPFPAA